MLVRSQIGLVFEKKLNDAKITDQSLRSAIKTNFMAWLANAIQSGTANLNVDSTNVYMFNEVVVELERQRKVLRTSPLPATPVTTTDGPSIGPNRRSRLRDLVKK